MPAPYNTSLLDNATNLYEVTKEINVLADGLLASLILLVVGIYLVMIFRDQYNFSNVVMGVGFIMTLVAIGFWASGLVGMTIVLFPVLLLAVGAFIKIWGG